MKFDPATDILNLDSIDQCLILQRNDKASLPLLCHEAVRQAVYIGTHLLNHLYKSPPIPQPAQKPDLVPMMLYRGILDIGDSIGTLARFESVPPSLILIRSL